LATRHRDLIIALAARHRLPAVYAYRYMVAAGGLASYGPDSTDRAATLSKHTAFVAAAPATARNARMKCASPGGSGPAR
jgi:hypothetical protein